MAAHHGGIPGVILNAIFLLKAGFMRFIDNDQTQIAIGQIKRRARANRHQCLSTGNGAIGPPPLRLTQVRMPSDRRMAETIHEAPQKGLGQGNFGQEDQRLLPPAQRLRHCLKIHFGFARSGHPIEQHGGKVMRGDKSDQIVRCGLLLCAQLRRGMIGVRGDKGGVERNLNPFQHACLHQPAHNGFGHIGQVRQFANQALPISDPIHRLRALRRHAIQLPSRQAIFGDRACALQRGGRGKGHAQHRLRRGKIIVRRPFDQTAQRRAQRRHVIHL